MNGLEDLVRRYRGQVDLRSRAYRARMSSEGVWTRVALALTLAGPKGLYRVTRPPVDGVSIGSLFSLSGRSLEVFVKDSKPNRSVPVSLEDVLRDISSSPRKNRAAIVCVVPPFDESRSGLSDVVRLLGCRGGRCRSPRKSAAARRNGRKGGRPVARL